jgi:hypothetical protein
MKLPDEIRSFFQQQGRIGAAKRFAGMSPRERQELARRAAQSRWKKVKQAKAKKVKSEAQ